ncbi:MAG: LPS export ABC transporter permease LptF [Desulfuromonadales bacterium]|nr:LPS export ABC transporter permease LptF [Desulfuromonadales bacterium]
MSRSQIHRYIYREVLSPTLLGLLVFTLVLLMGRLVKLVDLVINKGISLWDILILFGTMIPSFLTISLPLALLMGIMIGLSRMSADSETIALKAAGLSLTNIGLPVFALAIIFSLLTGAAGLWAEPWGYRAFKTKVFEITRQKASIGFRPQIFMDQFDNLVFYADSLDDRTGKFRNLFIVEKRAEGDTLIVADSGQVSADAVHETVTIHLSDGSIHRLGDGASDNSYQIINFRNYDVHPDLGPSALPKVRSRIKAKELSSAELMNKIRGEDNESKRHLLNAELYRRFSTPLAPLLFALFALPFGIQSQRSGRSGGIIIGLMIYLCYYFLFSLAKTMTAEGTAPAWLSFWAMHLVMISAGLYLLHRSSLEKPNRVVVWVNIVLARFKPRNSQSENS